MDAHTVVYPLDFELFDQLTAERGWVNDKQRADGIGVSHTTLGRIRKGLLQPGARFQARATTALGVSRERLFPERIKAPVGAS